MDPLVARQIRRGQLIPGPATQTPGPEPPAIVDLLTQGWTPTIAGPIATLLDLGARGYLRLLAEPSGRLFSQVPSPIPIPSEPLTLFEQQLHQYAVGRSSGASAPAAALLPDPEDEDGKRWYATFNAGVIDEARRVGLVVGPTLGRGIEGTVLGRAAAGRWLGVRTALLTASQQRRFPEGGGRLKDRMLAWAVALGAAPDVHDALAPADDWVWSSTGDRWREVWVSTSRKGSAQWWTTKGRDPANMSGRLTLSGRVVRRWKMVQPETGADPPYSALYNHFFPTCFLALDDGHNVEALVWRVNKSDYERLTLDSTVQVTIDYKGRLVDIT
jgi:hypothetical protein